MFWTTTVRHYDWCSVTLQKKGAHWMKSATNTTKERGTLDDHPANSLWQNPKKVPAVDKNQNSAQNCKTVEYPIWHLQFPQLPFCEFNPWFEYSRFHVQRNGWGKTKVLKADSRALFCFFPQAIGKHESTLITFDRIWCKNCSRCT